MDACTRHRLSMMMIFNAPQSSSMHLRVSRFLCAELCVFLLMIVTRIEHRRQAHIMRLLSVGMVGASPARGSHIVSRTLIRFIPSRLEPCPQCPLPVPSVRILSWLSTGDKSNELPQSMLLWLFSCRHPTAFLRRQVRNHLRLVFKSCHSFSSIASSLSFHGLVPTIFNEPTVLHSFQLFKSNYHIVHSQHHSLETHSLTPIPLRLNLYQLHSFQPELPHSHKTGENLQRP